MVNKKLLKNASSFSGEASADNGLQIQKYSHLETIDIEPGVKEENMGYSQSMQTLKQRGYQRHPRPWEIFSLLIGHLEDDLPPGLDTLANNLWDSSSEWFDVALLRWKHDELIFYVGPQNLRVVDPIKGDYDMSSYEYKRSFKVKKGREHFTWFLDELPEELVSWLYTKPRDKLPKEFTTGDLQARIYIPYRGICPLSRGQRLFRFDTTAYFGEAVSRGVQT